jgi:hypothetical protein
MLAVKRLATRQPSDQPLSAFWSGSSGARRNECSSGERSTINTAIQTLQYTTCVFVYLLINFYSFVIRVLYAPELISFICIVRSFQVGETNTIAGVLCGCEVLLGTHHIYCKSVFNKQSLRIIYSHDYAV